MESIHSVPLQSSLPSKYGVKVSNQTDSFVMHYYAWRNYPLFLCFSGPDHPCHGVLGDLLAVLTKLGLQHPLRGSLPLIVSDPTRIKVYEGLQSPNMDSLSRQDYQ